MKGSNFAKSFKFSMFHLSKRALVLQIVRDLFGFNPPNVHGVLFCSLNYERSHSRCRTSLWDIVSNLFFAPHIHIVMMIFLPPLWLFLKNFFSIVLCGELQGHVLLQSSYPISAQDPKYLGIYEESIQGVCISTQHGVVLFILKGDLSTRETHFLK